MASVGGYYRNTHVSQYDGSKYEHQNCAPASAANGLAAVSGGHTTRTGGQVRALLPRGQETNPNTPGWSIPDVDHAMAKLNVGFLNRSGQGWGAVRLAHSQGYYIVLSGDSDRFSNRTCSGKFEGAHTIGVHPATAGTKWWIDDPICGLGRWEEEAVLKAYARKLAGSVWFGVFTRKVPKA